MVLLGQSTICATSSAASGFSAGGTMLDSCVADTSKFAKAQFGYPESNRIKKNNPLPHLLDEVPFSAEVRGYGLVVVPVRAGTA